jgi:predicted membrane metal-binding protein
LKKMATRKLAAVEPEFEPEVVVSASDRSFGFVFAAVFAIVGAWPLLDGQWPRFWPLVVAGLFVLVATFAPWFLRPLNAVWIRLGVLLHRVVTPVVMGIVFFLVVVPTALIMRALGKDSLRLRLDQDAETYWIKREPPGPAPQTMTRQF